MGKHTDPAPGERHNRLTLIRYSHTGKHYRRHFVFECDCGNETTLSIEAVRSGNTKSCGCLALEVKRAKRIPDNYAEITAIILGYKRHARDRGIEWHLTREKVNEIVRKPCHYCGDPAGNLKRTKYSLQGFPHNGIDRQDAGGSYRIGNVVPCCGTCNVAKGTRSESEFIEWARRIAAR